MKVAKQTEKMFVLENQLDLLGKLNKLNRLRLFAKYLLQLVAGWGCPANFAEKYSIEWEKSGSGWQFISFLAKSQIGKLQTASSFAFADLLSEPSTNY